MMFGLQTKHWAFNSQNFLFNCQITVSGIQTQPKVTLKNLLDKQKKWEILLLQFIS